VRCQRPERIWQQALGLDLVPGPARAAGRAPARVRMAGGRDTAVTFGAVLTSSASVADRFGNARPERPTITAGVGRVLDVDSATGRVTARDMGTQWLYARYGASVDSARVRVLPNGRLVVWDAPAMAVRLVDLDGGGLRTVTTNVYTRIGVFPRFDASGRQVLIPVVENDDYWPAAAALVDTTGRTSRVLGPPNAFVSVLATRQLADGSVLVAGARESGRKAPFAVWRVAPDDSLTLVAPIPELNFAGYGGIDISYDGTRIAYVDDAGRLMLLELVTGVTRLLDANGHSPRWSPQGDRVAYLVHDAMSAELYGVMSGNPIDGTLAVIGADGSGRRALGTRVYSPGLTWSPDGTYLAARMIDWPFDGDTDNYDYWWHVLRVRDAVDVRLRLPLASGAERGVAAYYQADWR